MNNLKWVKILRIFLSVLIAAAWIGLLTGLPWARELWVPLLSELLRWPAAGRYFSLLSLFAIGAAILLYPLRLLLLYVPGPLADRIYWLFYTKLWTGILTKSGQACQRRQKPNPAWLIKLDEHSNRVLLWREGCIGWRTENAAYRERRIVVALRILLILAIVWGTVSILLSAGAGASAPSEGMMAGYQQLAYSHWRSLDRVLAQKSGLRLDDITTVAPAQAKAQETLRCTAKAELQAAEGCALYLAPDEGSLTATIAPGVSLTYEGGVSDDGISKWVQVATPFGGTGWAHSDTLSHAPPESIETISPDEASASSYFTDPTGSYPAENAIDANHETAWTADSADPESQLDLKFSQDTEIGSILLVNGFAASPMLYQMNDRVKKLQITFSEGETVTCEVPDVYSPYGFELQLNQPVKAAGMKLAVEEVYGGSTYQGVCITEVAVHPAN